MAGLQPGDQVLELDGQNVSSLSTKALVALAQTLKTVPPSIGVVSRIEQVSYSSLTCHLMNLTCNRLGKKLGIERLLYIFYHDLQKTIFLFKQESFTYILKDYRISKDPKYSVSV